MKKFSLFIAIIFISTNLFAQTADTVTKKINAVNISGSVDGYYRYDFNNPHSAPYNSFTSFTKSSNSFELGMASVRADHSFGKVSATIDLGFGNRAEEFAYNDANTRLAVKQAYLTFAPTAAIKFTAGSWATHVGYEMLDPYLNRNYSMSYMFTNGPFSHTGIKADINLKGKTAMMIGISNPTDYRTAPAMPKSVIAQISTGSKDDKLKLYLNLVSGKQSAAKKVTQVDVVANYTVSGKFSIGINGTSQSGRLTDSTNKTSNYIWNGVALYLNFDPVSWMGITLRTEYIDDKDQYLGLKKVFAPTLSANFKIDNLTIIPELRFDNAGNKVFYKNSTTSTMSTANFIVAACYHF
jgi:hypothetical protein